VIVKLLLNYHYEHANLITTDLGAKSFKKGQICSE